MDDLVERMVEAGARGIYDGRRAPHEATWDELDERARDCCRYDARACLTAAHAEAELDGVILTRVPGSVETVFGVETIFGDDSAKGHVEGWSLCRAAVLAGQVTP